MEVGSVSLGGETPTEAERLLQKRTTGELGAIELNGPETVSLTSKELDTNYDVVATVKAAYSVGREGSVLKRISERLNATLGGAEVPLEVEYRTEAVRDQVELMASRLNAEPQEANVEIRGSEVEVTPSSDGYQLDVEATLAGIEEAVRILGDEASLAGEVLEPEVTTAEARNTAEKARRAMSGPLILTSGGREWTISRTEIGTALNVVREDNAIDGLGEYMEGMYEDLNVKPKEAGYDVEGDEVLVTPGESGRKIEDQKLFDSLARGVFEGRRSYEIPIAEAEPILTTTEARQQKPTTVLASYQTNYLTYDDTPGRIDNLEIASEAVSGTAIAPGEVFPSTRSPSHLTIKTRKSSSTAG